MEHQHCSDHHWDKTQSQLLQALYEWLLCVIYYSRSHVELCVWSLGEKGSGSDAAAGRGCSLPCTRGEQSHGTEQDKQTEHKTGLSWTPKNLEQETRLPILNMLPKNYVSQALGLYFPGFLHFFFTKSTLYCSTINTADSALYAEWSIYQLSQSHERAKRKTEVFDHPSTSNCQSIWMSKHLNYLLLC